ncbi:hypothetical protein CPB85DRAFT_1438824 [Mucidula mucida]|nr:hypothetical protein CPB85DRAFT_1438824 [Mucidula mucida]
MSSPGSSPSPPSDSDSDAFPWTPEPGLELKSAIAMTPEAQLRTIMEKLAGNPTIRRSIARELSFVAKPRVTPPPRRKSLHKKRPSAEQAMAEIRSPTLVSLPSCVKCGRVFSDGWEGLQKRLSEGPCVFHPGSLEVFEFPAPNAEGRAHTMSMWTCCEADHDTSGCVSANTHHFGSF